MQLLRDETPAPKPVRVSGNLETISASSSEIVLKLGDGTKVPVAASVAQDAVSGVAAFFGTWPGEETVEELLGALEARVRETPRNVTVARLPSSWGSELSVACRAF